MFVYIQGRITCVHSVSCSDDARDELCYLLTVTEYGYFKRYKDGMYVNHVLYMYYFVIRLLYMCVCTISKFLIAL